MREDDGIGWRAAELLEERLFPGAAEIIRCHQLTPELAAKFEQARVVVFLDAACDQEPGIVSCVSVQADEAGVWSHQLSPGHLLALTKQLSGQAPPAFLIRGGVLRMGLGETLTESGERTAVQMAEAAHTLLTG